MVYCEKKMFHPSRFSITIVSEMVEVPDCRFVISTFELNDTCMEALLGEY